MHQAVDVYCIEVLSQASALLGTEQRITHENGSSTDAEGCVQIICHLLPRLPPGQSEKAAGALAAALSSDVSIQLNAMKILLFLVLWTLSHTSNCVATVFLFI